MSGKRTLWSVVVACVLMLSLSFSSVFGQGSLTYGAGIVDSIDAETSFRIYTFNGMEGDLITARIISLTDGFSPTLSLNSPAQQQLASSSSDPFSPGASGARIDLRLTESGNHALLVGSIGGSQGNYVLTLDGAQTPPPAMLTGALSPAEFLLTPEGTIEPFSFAANPDALLDFSLSADFAFTATVRTEDGRLVAILTGDTLQGASLQLAAGMETYEVMVTPLEDIIEGTVVAGLDTGPVTAGPAAPDHSPAEPGAPLPADQCVVVASAGGVNVRSGPSTNFSAIGTLAPNAFAPATGIYQNWYEIDYNGQIGWVSATVVTPNGPCDMLPAATPPMEEPMATEEMDMMEPTMEATMEGDMMEPTMEGDTMEPTMAPPTEAPPTQEASLPVAPPGPDVYNFTLDRSAATQQFNQALSYPQGDNSDRVRLTVDGLSNFAPNRFREYTFVVICNGTNTENLRWGTGGPSANTNRTCGQSTTGRFSRDSNQMFINLNIPSGSSPSYVQYTIIATQTNAG